MARILGRGAMVAPTRATLLVAAALLGGCTLPDRTCAALPSGPVLAGFVRGGAGADLSAAVAGGVNVLIFGRDTPLQLASGEQFLGGPNVTDVAAARHMHVQHLVFVDCAGATGSAESIAASFGDWNDAFATRARGAGKWQGFDGVVLGGKASPGTTSFDKDGIELVRLSLYRTPFETLPLDDNHSRPDTRSACARL